MKDTACENCPFKAMGFEECPNYIETLWHTEGELQPQIVRDCAPKRNLLMTQELYNRFFGLQKQVNQLETETCELRSAHAKLFNAIKYVEEQKEIEASSKAKLLRHMQTMKYCEPEKFKRVDFPEGRDVNSV